MFFNNQKSANQDLNFSTTKRFNFKYLLIILSILLILIGGYFLYSKLASKKYYLVLNGDTDIVIKQNTPYEEVGFEAHDNRGNDLHAQVIIEGEVNSAVVGEYTLTYKLNNITKERTILVVAEENQITYLILFGKSTIFLKVGETYLEPGFTVIDNLEDNLNDQVKITGEVNSNVVGTYKINYSVTNKSGQTINEERTIIVNDTNINVSYTPTNATSEAVSINLLVTDNYFDYILLPDNTKTFDRNIVYKVTQNGTYNFTIYSKDGSYKQQEIKINNIDKTPPSGTCSGYYKKGNSYISINANDNQTISKYVINNQEFTRNQITLNQELSTVTIYVYDKANNQGVIKCNLKNENTIYPAYFGVKLYKPDNDISRSYWLYVPENATDNMPMIVFIHGKGEMGNDAVNQQSLAITWGPGRDIQKQNAKFPAIVLMPQIKEESGYWSSFTIKNIVNLINQIADEYNVNKNRISLAGFSLGCSSVPTFLKYYPNYFSAAVPIECQSHSSMEYAKLYANIPTWTFASAEGTNEELSRLVKNINLSGGNAKHSYYPNMGHTGLVGYNDYSIFIDDQLKLVDWMISQERQ